MMNRDDVDRLREVWKRGTWDDGVPVEISVEWLLLFTMEDLIEVLRNIKCGVG
jgi:hypothetical protein